MYIQSNMIIYDIDNIFIAQPIMIKEDLSAAALLHQACQHLPSGSIDDIVMQMSFAYPVPMATAVKSQQARNIRIVYERFQSVPQSSTRRTVFLWSKVFILGTM
jgi:hypothetical protein